MAAPAAQVNQAGTQAWNSSSHQGFIGSLMGEANRLAAEGRAQSSINSSAHAMAGDNQTLPTPSMGNPNYAAMTAPQLHAAIMAAKPSDPVDVSDAWNDIGNKLVTLHETLAKAASTASSGWQGQAAQQALSFHSQVAGWVNNAAAGAQVTSVNSYNQSSAVSNARNSMPEPYTYTMSQAIHDVMASSNPIAAVPQAQANLDKAAATQRQAVDVAEAYHTSLSQASEQMPQLAETPTFSNNPSGGSASGSGSTGPAGAGGSGSGGGGGGFAPHFAGGGAPGGQGGAVRMSGGSGGYHGAPNPGGSNGSSGSDLNTQGYNPGGGSTSPGSTLTNPGGNNGPRGGQFNGPGSGPGSGPDGMPIGGVPIGGGFGQGAAGADSYSPRGGAFGSGQPGGYSRGGGFGPTGSQPNGGSSSGANGPRSAAGATAAEDAAIERGAATARGASGASAGGMGGARGQRGEGDREHKRASYLVEGDPDSIFGTDEKTAPPVIGG